MKRKIMLLLIVCLSLAIVFPINALAKKGKASVTFDVAELLSKKQKKMLKQQGYKTPKESNIRS